MGGSYCAPPALGPWIAVIIAAEPGSVAAVAVLTIESASTEAANRPETVNFPLSLNLVTTSPNPCLTALIHLMRVVSLRVRTSWAAGRDNGGRGRGGRLTGLSLPRVLDVSNGGGASCGDSW